jgi:hypothetical protein
MKKIILACGVLTVAAVLYWPRPVPQVSEKFDPVLARERTTEAADLAARPAAAGVGAQDLGSVEVEKRISAIDAEIAEKKLVEKSNRGALSTSELSELRRLLGLRNEYFSRKLDLELGSES